MLINVDNSTPVPIIQVTGHLGAAGTVDKITGLVDAYREKRVEKVILSVADGSKASFAAVFALVEVASRAFGMRIAMAVESRALFDLISQHGIARHLELFQSTRAALKVVTTPIDSLKNVQAVVLAAGKGSRIAPLSNELAKPMLNIAGLTVLERQARHLADCGIEKVLVNPGYHGPALIEKMSKSENIDMTFYPEGFWDETGWSPDPIGSASTLASLTKHYHAIEGDDVIVMCGDALANIDLHKMYKHHKDTSADITVAGITVADELVHQYGIIDANTSGRILSFQEKPNLEDAKSRLANIGVYIFSAKVLHSLTLRKYQDIGEDILQNARANGLQMQVFHSDCNWLDVGCGCDYFKAVQQVLEGKQPNEFPTGKQIKKGLWVEKNVTVGATSRVNGYCHIQTNSHVASDVLLEGSVSIGENCVIQAGCEIKNSIVLPDTVLQPGTRLDSCIAGPDYVFSHASAFDGRVEYLEIDGVVSHAQQSQLLSKAV